MVEMNLLVAIFVWLLLGLSANQINTATVSNDNRTTLNVAVIGAGVSGLCSAKHCIAQGLKVTVYEQSEEIGGIWYYTDEIGKDKYGVPIHSPMYQGLRVHVPHQVMSYPDFPYPTNTTSYPTQVEVLKYLHSYANHFELEKNIKFSHLVVRVIPIENDKWEIIVKNLRTNTFETKIYDVVFVCNGRFSKPFISNIDGADEFNGKMIHSRDYRRPEPFCNTSVLVIGGGLSGTDLVSKLLEVASRVTFSRLKIANESEEARKQCQNLYAPNVILKDDVRHFTSTGAEFIDGSHQTFDVVFFATGYNYSFPFLSLDSGVHVEKKLVQPLYKYIFNVEHPTMVFIGIPEFLANTHMLSLQVRFVIKFLSGAKKLPTKSEMLQDVQIQKTKKLPSNLKGENEEHIKQLSEMAEIEPVPTVLLEITKNSAQTRKCEPTEFRNYRYKIINDTTFVKEKYVT